MNNSNLKHFKQNAPFDVFTKPGKTGDHIDWKSTVQEITDFSRGKCNSETAQERYANEGCGSCEKDVINEDIPDYKIFGGKQSIKEAAKKEIDKTCHGDKRKQKEEEKEWNDYQEKIAGNLGNTNMKEKEFKKGDIVLYKGNGKNILEVEVLKRSKDNLGLRYYLIKYPEWDEPMEVSKFELYNSIDEYKMRHPLSINTPEIIISNKPEENKMKPEIKYIIVSFSDNKYKRLLTKYQNLFKSFFVKIKDGKWKGIDNPKNRELLKTLLVKSNEIKSFIPLLKTNTNFYVTFDKTHKYSFNKLPFKLKDYFIKLKRELETSYLQNKSNINNINVNTDDWESSIDTKNKKNINTNNLQSFEPKLNIELEHAIFNLINLKKSKGNQLKIILPKVDHPKIKSITQTPHMNPEQCMNILMNSIDSLEQKVSSIDHKIDNLIPDTKEFINSDVMSEYERSIQE